MSNIKLTDGSIYNGGDVYAYNASGMFEPLKVSGDMVRATQNHDDVFRCNEVGTLWIVNSGAICFYTVAPKESYVCLTTTQLSTFNRWVK